MTPLRAVLNRLSRVRRFKPPSQSAADLARRAKINQVWSADSEQRALIEGWYWMAHPAVQGRLNRLASGTPDIDVYGHLAQTLRGLGFELPLERCLSLGCGAGGLERHLASAGMVRCIQAYDIAEGALAKARQAAAEGNYQGLEYHLVDLETVEFPPGKTDIVFAHQSIHHVEKLESLFAKVRQALRRGGVFHLHEFVGPSRFQWTDEQLRLVNGFLDSLPASLRRLPNGAAKPAMARPTIEAMIAADPSEAIRSKDIVPALRQHFDIIEHRALGGAVMHLALGDIAQNFDPADPDHAQRLDTLAAMEDQAMAEGKIDSDFDVLTAVRR